MGYLTLLPKLSQTIVIKYYSNFSLIFMQDSGIKPKPDMKERNLDEFQTI